MTVSLFPLWHSPRHHPSIPEPPPTSPNWNPNSLPPAHGSGHCVSLCQMDKRSHGALFLWLDDFTQRKVLRIQPCCSLCANALVVWSWIIWMEHMLVAVHPSWTLGLASVNEASVNVGEQPSDEILLAVLWGLQECCLLWPVFIKYTTASWQTMTPPKHSSTLVG